jgi:hypothetical protein
MIKTSEWKYLGFKRRFGKMNMGTNKAMRKTGGRDKGVKTYNFEYINTTN